MRAALSFECYMHFKPVGKAAPLVFCFLRPVNKSMLGMKWLYSGLGGLIELAVFSSVLPISNLCFVIIII